MVAIRRKAVPKPLPQDAGPPAQGDPIPQQRALYNRITAVERIVRNFKALIGQNQDLLRDESIMHQIALLEEWLETYKRGLVAADKIRTQGMQWLERHRAQPRAMSQATPSLAIVSPPTRILKQVEKELEQPAPVQPTPASEPVAPADTALPAPR